MSAYASVFTWLLIITLISGSFSDEPKAIKTSRPVTFEEEKELKTGETGEIHAVVIGGVDDKKTSHKNLQIYTNGGWKYLKEDMGAPLNSMGAANLEGSFFVAGGKEKTSREASANPPKNDVSKRTKGQFRWHPDFVLNQARTFPTLNAVQTADGTRTLMVTGGLYLKGRAMKSTEIYQANIGWRLSKPMLGERYGHAALMLGGDLHVLGGHNQNDSNTWFTTEFFDFNAMMWRLGEPMNEAREFHAASVLDGELYTCGGYEMHQELGKGRVFHKSCEKLHQGEFVEAETMNVARAGFGMVTIGEEIWAIGGFNQAKEALDSVERLIYKTALRRREWDKHPAKLRSPRKLFGATTLQVGGHSNVRRLESANKVVNSTFV